MELGLTPTWARGQRFQAGFSTEYLHGFALNSFYSVDFDGSNRGLGRTGVGVFHNLRRETLASPGIAFRFDTFLPTGRDANSSRGVDFRARGILSRTLRGNERLHLNLDAVYRTSTTSGSRAFVPSAVIGYTRPVGYPKRFDRTALAEIAFRSDEETGRGNIISVGAGLRQQVTPRAVADIGIQTDAVAHGGATRTHLRLVAGYSTSF